jgi:hypothetical protein
VRTAVKAYSAATFSTASEWIHARRTLALLLTGVDEPDPEMFGMRSEGTAGAPFGAFDPFRQR